MSHCASPLVGADRPPAGSLLDAAADPRQATSAPTGAAAARSARPTASPGFTLARRLAGERALPVDRGMVLLSPARLCRHLLVCGATGSGKTETAPAPRLTPSRDQRRAGVLPGRQGRPRDRRSASCGLMADAGRGTRVFPNEPFDGWRGQPHEIHGRLMEIIDYASDGPAAWYRDVAKNVLRLVCEHPDGPPRSSARGCSADGRRRARQGAPRRLERARGARPRSRSARCGCATRRSSGRPAARSTARWAWEDTQAAYLLLDSLALREETSRPRTDPVRGLRALLHHAASRAASSRC